jgi:hypothetical protein
MVSGGSWFTFTTTGEGVNTISFPVEYERAELLSPPDGTIITKSSQPIVFSWDSVVGATGYQIYIDNLSGFGNPEVGFDNGGGTPYLSDGITTETSFPLTEEQQQRLDQNVYYWKVYTLGYDGVQLIDSSIRSFTLMDPTSSLLSPDDGSQFVKGVDNLQFSWTPLDNVSGYQIYIDNASGFGSPEVGFDNGQGTPWIDNGIVTSPIFTLTRSLQQQLPQNTYFWEVFGLDSQNQQMAPSFSWHFNLVEPVLTLSNSMINVGNEGQQDSVTIDSNVAWEFSNIPDWIMLSPQNGSSSTSVSIEIGENTSINPRNAELILRDTQELGINLGLVVSQGGTTGIDTDVLSFNEAFTAYPNPFNPAATIEFTLPQGSDVSLDIYNIRGEMIISLCRGFFTAGEHSLLWNGKNSQNNYVSSGEYFCCLRTPTSTKTIKILLMK